jgi:hypothetical protein
LRGGRTTLVKLENHRFLQIVNLSKNKDNKEPTTIPAIFNKNIKDEVVNICQLSWDNDIPIIDKGGNNATEIAVPGIDSMTPGQ